MRGAEIKKGGKNKGCDFFCSSHVRTLSYLCLVLIAAPRHATAGRAIFRRINTPPKQIFPHVRSRRKTRCFRSPLSFSQRPGLIIHEAKTGHRRELWVEAINAAKTRNG